MPRILPASSHRRMPWRNGGGVTDEILIEPHPQEASRFAWRVSVARVESDGPFSLFPGIDRILTLLDGRGMVLHMGDGAPQRIDRPFHPTAFPGEMPIDCRLIDGPVRDLNVMTDRAIAHARVRIIEGDASDDAVRAIEPMDQAGSMRDEADGNALEPQRLVVALNDTVTVTIAGCAGATWALAPLDALRLEGPECAVACTVTLPPRTAAAVIDCLPR